MLLLLPWQCRLPNARGLATYARVTCYSAFLSDRLHDLIDLQNFTIVVSAAASNRLSEIYNKVIEHIFNIVSQIQA